MDNEILYRLADSMDAEKFKLLNDLFNGPDTNDIEDIRKHLGNIESERVLVAEYKGNLIGFCCGQLIKSVCYKTYSFELTEIYVEEDYQKKGVGKGLIEHVEFYCNKNNIRKIELLTGSQNFNAQSFYEHLGYTKTNQIHYKKRISELNEKV
ncbi:GNAT family N-acetyltransferase [Clostridium sp. YIM B02505]|uniref:GNAT family N-acetyltransferase n=1 Tax=Clostridium yunnanense TaxID=2800325 RepID=A0ABS1EUT6_9CLOT|nr:GNAT family N-acetyltransferase [Clostridium yunnanense]MBK1813143.1 GNAT family N-acetyltransferase [Clostridium yunnanense]